MKTRSKILSSVLAGVLVAGLALPAAAEVVRGRDLLSQAEWEAHRVEMQAAKTQADRDAVRQKMMQLVESRAAEKGDVLMHNAQPGVPGCVGGGPGWVGPRVGGPHGGPHWGPRFGGPRWGPGRW